MGRLGDILAPRRAPTRLGRIAIDGSPTFRLENGAIAANATEVVNLEENPTHGNRIAKYLPLDFLEIQNQQAGEIEVVLNDSSEMVYPILGNSQRVITRRKITGFKIVNTSANAIAANTINMTLERVPADADELARRRVRERYV